MEQALKLKQLASDMSVLYVEDERAIRDETTEFLKKFFLSVDIARNGKEGVEQFKKHRQDLIITDIVMPVMEGHDMIDEIKRIDPKIPVIIISAYDFADYAQPGERQKADAFIRKPAAYNTIVETLCTVIESSKGADDTISLLKKGLRTLSKRVEMLEEKVVALESKLS